MELNAVDWALENRNCDCQAEIVALLCHNGSVSDAVYREALCLLTYGLEHLT